MPDRLGRIEKIESGIVDGLFNYRKPRKSSHVEEASSLFPKRGKDAASTSDHLARRNSKGVVPDRAARDIV